MSNNITFYVKVKQIENEVAWPCDLHKLNLYFYIPVFLDEVTLYQMLIFIWTKKCINPKKNFNTLLKKCWLRGIAVASTLSDFTLKFFNKDSTTPRFTKLRIQ